MSDAMPPHDRPAKVGVVVPPANPAVEPEMRLFLPNAVDYYVTRLPTMPGLSLEQRNENYVSAYQAALPTFGNLAIKAISIALTGASYRLLPDGDAKLCATLQRSAGIPVFTASAAVRDMLERLNTRHLTLVSPYPSWLTKLSVAYWEACGLTLSQVVQVSEDFRAYELTTEEILTALRRVDPSLCDAVLISGTGTCSAAALAQMNPSFGPPILSSNLCGAWWLTRQVGSAPSPGLIAACPQIAV